MVGSFNVLVGCVMRWRSAGVDGRSHSQTPAVSRSSQCAAEHDGHLGNAETKEQTGQQGNLVFQLFSGI